MSEAVIYGWVVDAGGGHLNIMVSRDTMEYQTIGTRVVVVPAEQYEQSNGDDMNIDPSARAFAREYISAAAPSLKVEATTLGSKEHAYALAYELMAAADRLWGWTPERVGY